MSRLGKRKLSVPAGVTFTQEGNSIKVAGPRGTLARSFDERIKVRCTDGVITLEPVSQMPVVRALWGTTSAHLVNLLTGVTDGFSRVLLLEGLGYKAAVSGDQLTLNLGFSHPNELAIPEGLTVVVEKNSITISGIDRELVGQFAAKIRDLKRVEPYKGTGIRYDTEIVRRKVGKRVTA